jgi:hypothetical protein
MLIGVGVVSYDTMTIRASEEIEEDTSKLLLNAEQWLNHQQAIEAAVLDYVYAGSPGDLPTIEENRHAVAVNEQAMRDVINEYHPEESLSSIERLLTLTAKHQLKVDEIVARNKAGDHIQAQRLLAESQKERFIYVARQLTDNMTSYLQVRRIGENSKVSLNVLRGSISFGLMTILMVAVIWVSYIITTRTQRKNRVLSEQLLHRATHDSLTNLPNRDMFHDRVSQSISLARRN